MCLQCCLHVLISLLFIYIFVSQILSQPLSIIIKKYFVPIFGLCIAVRCGTGPEKDLAETVLCESVLQLGEISELERDDLIKKHMVCFPIRTSLNLHVLRDVPLLCDSKLSALSGLFHDTVVLDYFGSK